MDTKEQALREAIKKHGVYIEGLGTIANLLDVVKEVVPVVGVGETGDTIIQCPEDLYELCPVWDYCPGCGAKIIEG